MHKLQTIPDVPTWRRVAASSWGASDDPAIYGWLDIDASELMRYLDALREATGARVTITHAVGRAVAMAFAEHPECNALVSLGRLKRRPSVDVFFSVAAGDGKNVTGAKVIAVDGKSLVDIAAALDEQVTRIRGRGDTALQKSQALLGRMPAPLLRPIMRATAAAMFELGMDLGWAGVPFDPFGTVVVTNVGVLGIEQGFAPLVPQGRTPALFTVGRVRDKVVAQSGAAVVRPVLTLGGTFDHRIVDGYHLGKISRRLVEILEQPERLAVHGTMLKT